MTTQNLTEESFATVVGGNDIVLVDFWASWCGPCRLSFPWMEQMHRRYHAQGLEIIAVNLDEDRKLADRFLSRYTSSFLVGFDSAGTTPLAYGVKGMPSSVIIDHDGLIVAHHVGFSKHKRKEYEELIRSLLGVDAGPSP